MAAPKTFFLDSRFGRLKNSGLYPAEPKHPDEFHTLPLEPGDSVAFRAGQTHIGQFEHRRSGTAEKPINLKTFQLGGEGTWTAWLSSPDTSLKRPIAMDINASYINLYNLAAKETRYAGFLFRETQAYITGYNLKARRCGIGARLRSSYGGLDHPDFQDLVMSKDDGTIYAEGAVAFSLEGSDGHSSTGLRIYRPFVMNAWAPSQTGQDGGGDEIFGDVSDFVIEGGVYIRCKGGIEVGGPTPKADKRVSVTRNGIIQDNIFINCGVFMLFNDPASAFPIKPQGYIVRRNTVYERSRKLDAVHFKGEWGDVSKVIQFDDNVYSGLGAWVGSSGKTTKLSAIPRQENVYERLEGTELGYTPTANEFVGDPQFASAEMWDFRPLKAYPNQTYRSGALDRYVGYDSGVDLKWLFKQTRTPFTANDIKGGLHTVDYHKQMWAIPMPLRAAGMQCYVAKYGQMWQLDPNLLTWHLTESAS